MLLLSVNRRLQRLRHVTGPSIADTNHPGNRQLGRIATVILEGTPVSANDEFYSRLKLRIARFSFQTRSMLDFASRPDPAC